MVFLMYHELEADGRRLCHDAAGYLRYVVRDADFRAQMNCLIRMGLRGVNLGKALSFDPSSTAITFDDGCETDLAIAAPILREAGFGATFYITAGFLGKAGYLTTGQLRELSGLGFQVGCHSMTHAYLSDLDDNGLHREIVDSKTHLEQLIGKTVEHFSCPGGRYNQRAVDLVRKAKYQTMATSRNCSNFSKTDRFRLGRIPVLRGTTLQNFEAHCRGQGLWPLRIRESFRETAKNLLGNTLYDRLREFALDK